VWGWELVAPTRDRWQEGGHVDDQDSVSAHRSKRHSGVESGRIFRSGLTHGGGGVQCGG
jgi:hypothetical protein